MKFRNDIVAESVDAFDFSVGNNGTHDIADVLVNPLDNSLSSATGTVERGTPQFVDAANGNYRLAPYSLGIDVAPADAATLSDLDGNSRDIDEILIGNIDGPRDLGAYEFNGVLVPRPCSASDEIFCAQFE